jgi:hypothetical protein
MYQPTKTKQKDDNLQLPPAPPSIEELAEEQEPLVMVASQVLGLVSTLIIINNSPTTNELPAAPV